MTVSRTGIMLHCAALGCAAGYRKIAIRGRFDEFGGDADFRGAK
jgi:hypothetical protein